MTEWFLEKLDADGDEEAVVGPFTPRELLAMVRKGEVVPESRVRKDDSAWFAASAVGGLFEAAVRPTVQYFCPQCDTRVRQPPVVCPKCLRDIRAAREEVTENVIMDKNEAVKQSSRSVQNWLKKKVRKRKPNE